MVNAVKSPISTSWKAERDCDGVIVGAVLCIRGALASLVSIYSVVVINTATGFGIHEDRLRSEALVSAALELTDNRQFSTPAQLRLTHGEFAFHLGGAEITV